MPRRDESYRAESSLDPIEYSCYVPCPVWAPSRMTRANVGETLVYRHNGEAHRLSMHLARIEIALQPVIGFVRHVLGLHPRFTRESAH
jgi:hypothetical protein